MTDSILAFVAFAVLVAFLGILVFYVPRLDLGLVVGATLLLAGYDFSSMGVSTLQRTSSS